MVVFETDITQADYGMIELSITKDGDGLLLDFEHHGIMNSMDDDKAVDIFSYNIDMKGVESV